jgi:hypothetical protein
MQKKRSALRNRPGIVCSQPPPQSHKLTRPCMLDMPHHVMDVRMNNLRW